MNLNTGLNIAKQGSGKTRSLLSIMHRDVDYIYVTVTASMADEAASLFRKIFKYGIAHRMCSIDYHLRRRSSSDLKVLYDECFEYLRKLPILFENDIAVGTPPYRVTMIS